jgi:phosphoglycolate phosphatase
MSLQKPTFVIFDMDGTTVRHVNPRLLHVLEWLDDQAFKISRFTDWLLRRGGKGPMFLDIDEAPRKKKPKLLVHRAMHKLRRKSVEQIVEPCPGIYTVLDFLKAHDIPMALASNGLGKGYGHDVLEKFDLAPYFKATIFREDITKSKPHPEPILLAVQQSGLTPQEHDVIWYIGDRHKDISAAIAATKHLPCRIEPIAYAVNAAVAVIKNNLGPDHIIMSYHDMYVRLMLLLGKPPEKKREAPGKKSLAA